MNAINVRPYQESDRVQVIHVWHASGLHRPHNDPDKDINRKLNHSPEGFLVAVEGEHVIGTVMVGYDGHRGWINYLGVLPEWQEQGIGTLLMAHAEGLLRSVNCAKINLQVRANNPAVIAFYKYLGFGIDDCLSMGKRLEFDQQIEVHEI